MNLVALILSGGRGQRVGNQDKGLLTHHGNHLIQLVIDTLEPQVNQIFISHNRNTELYKQFGLPLLKDSNDQYQGPIAGILSMSDMCLEPTGALLVCPCDTPNIPPNLVSKLHQALVQNGCDAAIVFDGERQQNLHCLIRASMLSSLQQFYDSGGRAIREWFEQINTSRVDFLDQKECFSNYNTLTTINNNSA